MSDNDFEDYEDEDDLDRRMAMERADDMRAARKEG